MNYYLINVKSNLNSELIYDSYKNGKLDEEVASERLISIIENDSDEDNRFKSVEILGKIDSKQHKIFKVMENLLVSDSNEQIRGIAANIILQKYFDKGSEAINWALEHESSPKCLSIILESLKNINPKFVDSFVRAELNNFKENQPEIIEPYWDLDSLPYSLDWKIEIFVNCKFLSFLKENYGLNRCDYEIIDEEFKKIAIRGLKFKKISDIRVLENLTEIEDLDISYNQIEEVDNLEKFPLLKCLNLEGNKIKDIKGLESLEKLIHLNLSNNKIIDIKGLENLRELHYLDLSNNKISEMKGFENLSNLAYLGLENNLIHELKGIESLSNLQELNLLNNNIKDTKKPENLKNLWIIQ